MEVMEEVRATLFRSTKNINSEEGFQALPTPSDRKIQVKARYQNSEAQWLELRESPNFDLFVTSEIRNLERKSRIVESKKINFDKLTSTGMHAKIAKAIRNWELIQHLLGDRGKQ